jgi:hypothetical protein
MFPRSPRHGSTERRIAPRRHEGHEGNAGVEISGLRPNASVPAAFEGLSLMASCVSRAQRRGWDSGKGLASGGSEIGDPSSEFGATHDLRPTTHDLRPTTHDPRPTTHDLRPTTYDLRPTTYDLRPTTFGRPRRGRPGVWPFSGVAERQEDGSRGQRPRFAWVFRLASRSDVRPLREMEANRRVHEGLQAIDSGVAPRRT